MGNGGVLLALAVCIGGEGGDVPHGTGKCWGSHRGCFGVHSAALWQVARVCFCDGPMVFCLTCSRPGNSKLLRR